MQHHVLFFTSAIPSECAAYLDDFRVKEQLKVACSMLSTAVYCNRSRPGLPHISHKEIIKLYIPMNAGEPSVQWVRASRDNYRWVCSYLYQLILQARLRKLECDVDRALLDYMSYRGYTHYIPDGPLTLKPNAAYDYSRGINFGHYLDVYVANREFLQALWKVEKFKPKWTNVKCAMQNGVGP